MPNPQLTNEHRETLSAPLFKLVKEKLIELSGGDPRLLWALRRKLAKELIYEERGAPAFRKKLKTLKRKAQDGVCPICKEDLPEKEAELDRTEAYLGYTAENTRLVCRECHIEDQRKKNYM